MSIKLITPCVGRKACTYFRDPESLLDALEASHDFANLMMAMEIVRGWRKCGSCPFKVQQSDNGDGEAFHVSICALASHPPFSMDAVSRGTGYSKTRVAQIEYTACRKMKRSLGKVALSLEMVAAKT